MAAVSSCRMIEALMNGESPARTRRGGDAAPVKMSMEADQLAPCLDEFLNGPPIDAWHRDVDSPAAPEAQARVVKTRSRSPFDVASLGGISTGTWGYAPG